MFGANVSGKFFIAPPHVLLHHFRERVAVGWPRVSEHPCTFRASATLKIRPINPYQRAARSHHWMPLAVCVVDGPGHSLSLATGLPWVCVEQTTGKDESHILRIDTAESVGKPEGTQQVLWFSTYGSDHSTCLLWEGRRVISAGSLDAWSDHVPDSPIGEMLTVRSALVQSVKPPKAHQVSPLSR